MDKEDASSVGEDEQAEKECRKDTPGPVPEHQYNRDELFSLADAKLAKYRPKCLDKNYDTSEGLWDPEKWFRAMCGGSRENSPLTIGDGRDRDRRRPHDLDRDMLGRIRKTSTSDPKERLKEEQDGIVLSPQRRNFSTGCQVSKTSSSSSGGSGSSIFRQSSMNEYKDRDDRDRDRRDQRRIGSGRIQIDRDQGRDRERDYHRYDRDDRDRDRRGDRDRGDRDRLDRDRGRMDRDLDRDRDRDRDRNHMDRDRDRHYIVERSDQFRRGDSRDNRDFGDKMAERRDHRDRDFRVRDHDNRNDRRFDRGGAGRRRYHQEEETPEWFTGGPTSQSDTIELRGFEREGEKVKKSAQQQEEGEEAVVSEYPEEEKTTNTAVNEAGDAQDTTHGTGEQNGTLETNESESPESQVVVENRQSPQQPLNTTDLFDFNQFFNVEYFPEFATLTQEDSGSRFSKWFAAHGMSGNTQQSSYEVDALTNSNINNNLTFNHRNSPITTNEDFNYLSEMVEGPKSPAGPSPPPHAGIGLFGEKHHFPMNTDHLTHGPEHYTQQKNLPPIVSALFQNSAMEKSGNTSTPSSRGSFSAQDAEAQLKAMLFGGARDSASSSGTASPANVPPGLQRRMKTVAELEADMHQNSPHSPASTPHSTPAPVSTGPRPPSAARNDDGDQSAFNRLLNMMKVNSGGGPSVPMTADLRSLSPSFGVQAHNEFTQALLRNKEEQRQIQQFTLQHMQHPDPQGQPPQSQAQVQAQAHAQQLQQHLQHQLQQHAGLQAQGMMAKVPMMQHQGPSPQQQQQQQQQQAQPPVVASRPGLPQAMGRVPQRHTQDPLMNFIQQNPTIVMKPASPIPGMGSAQGPIPPSPLPSGLPPPSIRVSQQGTNPANARVPSPIMFSQQPPMHLSAPSPIHPVQLGPMVTGQSLSTNTLTTTSGMRSPVLQRVPSPQELVAHTQAILQTALIKRKLEDQKERYLKKQQERDKSPSQTNKPTVSATIVTPTTSNTIQTKQATMAFTPTSVIRKMHSDRVTEKEKQAKESDDDMGENHKQGLEKQGSESMDDSALGSGEMGMEASELHTNSSFNSNVSALSGHLEDGLHLGHHDDSLFPHHQQHPLPHQQQHHHQHHALSEGLEEKIFGGGHPMLTHRGNLHLIRPLVGQPVASPPGTTGGRPIVKGSTEPSSAGTPPQAPLQPRALTGGAPPPSRGDNEPRPITGSSGAGSSGGGGVSGSSGGGFDINKLMEQQRLHQQQQTVLPPHLNTPSSRPMGPGPAPPPPFMPIAPGHLPMQASMQGAMIMQQINRVNHMNHMNHLAALQAQQRMLDPRLQPLRAVMPTVNHGAPMCPMSPRSSMPSSAIPGLGPPISSGVGMSSTLKRAFSPAHSTFSQANKPMMNGPFSVGASVSGPNNCVQSETEILKWFEPEMLKTQLSSMPPLPTHGTKVMTVDEIERS